MSDPTITTVVTAVVTGLVTIVSTVAAVIALWIKLKEKIQDNTTKTEAISGKADTIVEQTNGNLDRVVAMVAKIAERVDKLEEYNHDSSHRLIDAVNAVHLRVVEIAARQPGAITPETPAISRDETISTRPEAK